PTFRYDFKGEGDVVLTTLSLARAALRFPPGRDYLLFSRAAGAVVAEITADAVARRLSVRPGRYFVRGRGPDHLLEGDLEIAAGDDRLVGEEGLRRVEYARLVRKGAVLRRVEGIEAAAFLRTPLVPGRSPCAGLLAGYAIDLRQATLK